MKLPQPSREGVLGFVFPLMLMLAGLYFFQGSLRPEVVLAYAVTVVPGTAAGAPLLRYHDAQAGVYCWRFDNAKTAVACLPEEATRLRTTKGEHDGR
jgi:hypothetical protein